MGTASQPLHAEQIGALLDTQSWGRSLQILQATASTMDDAMQAVADGAADGHTVVAEQQSKGRGAHGRVWESPAGTDLYLSVVSRPNVPLASSALLTLAVGLGVRETVAELVPTRRVEVKWPNDIWIDGLKCAGILVESRTVGATMDAVIIGIGLNVNRTRWAPEIADTATSLVLCQDNETPLDRNRVLASLLGNAERWVERFVTGGPIAVVDALRPHLALIGKQVRCDDVHGVLEGIAEDGAARIQTDAEVSLIRAGQLVPA